MGLGRCDSDYWGYLYVPVIEELHHTRCDRLLCRCRQTLSWRLWWSSSGRTQMTSPNDVMISQNWIVKQRDLLAQRSKSSCHSFAGFEREQVHPVPIHHLPWQHRQTGRMPSSSQCLPLWGFPIPAKQVCQFRLDQWIAPETTCPLISTYWEVVDTGVSKEYCMWSEV